MLEKILNDLETTGLSYTSHLLDGVLLNRLNNFFDQHRTDFYPAKIGMTNSRKRIESIRGDFTYWLNPLKPCAPFDEIFHFLSKLSGSLNKKFYFGIKDFECHLAYYPKGAFYNKHLDRFEKDSSRKVSFVFYLNESWDKSNGGEIVIYDKSGKEVKSLMPQPGAFLCFLSDEFPHEVKSSTKERRSLTGWMHNRILY
jgi:SM-20-related protein